ncbi:MAG TPA: ABC transporter permease [Vicinamibacterales bacterium]|jgi:cell division transport system permease protein|nr:ABC transporter permease [Vicinamibacterales bacterium]
MRALQYSFAEAIESLKRNRQSGLLSTATIALALFVVGAFFTITANLERLAEEWGRSAEMSVYLEDEITDEQRRAVELALEPGEIVAAQEYVSKEAALARFKLTFNDLARSIDSLGENPLPASYEVRLNPGAATEAGIDELGARLRETAGVADVRYDRQWLTRLMSAISLVRGVGLLMGGVLSLAAALTVAAVVRLALNARRDEIEIMQLVGAPTAFVRGPFVMEGVIQGGVGAVAALVALAVVFFSLRGSYLGPLAAAINLSTITFLPAELAVLLVFGGMAVGCVGGLVAAWGK